jgi:hypothetical protein
MVPSPRPQSSDSAQEHAAEQAQQGLQYMGSSTGDRVANLARGIDCFVEALRFFTPRPFPADMP